MKIELKERTEAHVRIYFDRAREPEVRRFLPQSAETMEQALEAYRAALLPGASSFGRTIYADGAYVGDIWCYGIDPAEEPNAMLSYCIFDRGYWNKGIATQTLALFLEEITRKFGLETIGAFAYRANTASIRVLDKNGFTVRETFTEDGAESAYLQWEAAR